jgi:Ca-activated chloride channel family protein
MTFIWPALLGALVLVPMLIAAYVWAQRARDRRAAAVGASGLVLTGGGRRAGRRRHLPFALLIAALAVMIFALSRPQATLATSRPTGTVLLVVDVSNSMGADDVAPNRLAVAQQAARDFVEAQPSTIEIGLVAFGNGALVTQQPSDSRADMLAAIDRLKVGGATSLGQGMLAGLTTIVGEPVSLPDPESTDQPPALGYFPSATMVLLTDGEDTGGPDPIAVAQLAAGAGIHVSTIGFGTADGAVIESEGYQVATALDAQMLTDIADVTGGTYTASADASTSRLDQISRSIDLRIATTHERTEITAAFAVAAVVLLVAGGLLMLHWFGRLV